VRLGRAIGEKKKRIPEQLHHFTGKEGTCEVQLGKSEKKKTKVETRKNTQKSKQRSKHPIEKSREEKLKYASRGME